MDRPVVVKKGLARVENPNLADIYFFLSNKTFPDLNIESTGLNLTGCNRGDRGIVGPAEGHALEILLRINVGPQEGAARHQVSGGAALRAKADILAFQICQRIDRRIAGDEY